MGGCGNRSEGRCFTDLKKEELTVADFQLMLVINFIHKCACAMPIFVNILFNVVDLH